MAHKDDLAMRHLSSENALLEAENRALREELRKVQQQLASIRTALRIAAARRKAQDESE